MKNYSKTIELANEAYPSVDSLMEKQNSHNYNIKGNNMKIKSSYLVLKTDKPIRESPSKLRGYLGTRFKEYPLLHNHLEEAGFLYTYPRIQYKVIGGQACILGIEEGSQVIKEISDQIDNLILGSKVYSVEEKFFTKRNLKSGTVQKPNIIL